MRPKRILIISALLLVVFGLTSCSHKLPMTSSKGTGILAIAHEATLSVNGWPFVYRYALSCSPASGPEIKIHPGAKNLYIFDNFPAGKYKLTAIELIPIRDNRASALEAKKIFPLPNEYNFEIKPKHITLLDKRFIVYNKDNNSNRFIQYHNFKSIKKTDREKIIKKLTEYENAGSWILPEL